MTATHNNPLLIRPERLRLPEGASVKVVGVDIGARDVEFEGRRFRIAMPCVDNGLEFWVDGKLISENNGTKANAT